MTNANKLVARIKDSQSDEVEQVALPVPVDFLDALFAAWQGVLDVPNLSNMENMQEVMLALDDYILLAEQLLGEAGEEVAEVVQDNSKLLAIVQETKDLLDAKE